MLRRLWADARHLVWHTLLRLVCDTTAVAEWGLPSIQDGDDWGMLSVISLSASNKITI